MSGTSTQADLIIEEIDREAAADYMPYWRGKPLQRLTEAFARHRLTATESQSKEVARLREALERARRVSTLLLQNSIGCAQNHHGHDFVMFGLPGWLAHAQAEIAKFTAVENKP